jgi:hypothetical protein
MTSSLPKRLLSKLSDSSFAFSILAQPHDVELPELSDDPTTIS